MTKEIKAYWGYVDDVKPVVDKVSLTMPSVAVHFWNSQIWQSTMEELYNEYLADDSDTCTWKEFVTDVQNIFCMLCE